MGKVKVEDLHLTQDILDSYQSRVEKESHKFANSLPWMDLSQTIQLIWSIMTKGFDKDRPIKKSKGKILDGRNREVAVRIINDMNAAKAKAEGKEPVLVQAVYAEADADLSKEQLWMEVFQDNIARRNLTMAQIAAYLVKHSETSGVQVLQDSLLPNKQYINQCKRLQAGRRHDLLDKVLHNQLQPLAAIKVMETESITNLEATPKEPSKATKPKTEKTFSEVSPPDDREKQPKAEVESEDVGEDPSGETKAEPEVEEAPKFYDDLGVEIPEALLRVFAAKKNFKAIIASIAEVKQELNVLMESDSGEFLREAKSGIESSIKYLGKVLRDSIPFAVCTHCNHTGVEPGKRKPCTVCNGARWLSVDRHKNHVPAVKKVEPDTEALSFVAEEIDFASSADDF